MGADILSAFVEKLKAVPSELGPDAFADEPDVAAGRPRALKRVSPPAPDTRAVQPLAAFRKTVADAMRRYMLEPEPDYMLLIPAPPGSGKTWAGVNFAHWLHELTARRVLYAGPRHDFYTDVVQAATAQGNDARLWYEWLPRQSADDAHGADETCKHVGPINTWMHRGYEAMDFCERVCHWDYIKVCPYHAQKARAEPLIFGQHAHVVLGHPLANQFAAVVGDEMPLSAFVHEWDIPARWIMPAGLALEEPLAEILNTMRRLCENDMTLHGAPLIYALGDPQSVIDACKLAQLPATAVVLPPTIYSAEQAAQQPFFHLPALLRLLQREAEAVQCGIEDFPDRIWLRPQGLTLLLRRSVNEQMPKHMIWFDATGTPDIYAALFERQVQTIDATPKLAGRIYQVTDRANGKRTMQAHNGTQSRYAHELGAQIKAVCEREQAQKPAVITFSALEEQLEVDTAHFYGSRGTNQFQDCDVPIVAGTPLPPLFQIEKYAKAIWHERMEPFNKTWLPIDRRYNYRDENGNGWAYPTSIFADYELNAVLWQYREAEIIQAAHRARILFRDVPVYLLTNIPIDELPPTDLLTIRELMDAPTGVHVFGWQAVLETAERLDQERGGITVADLMTELKVSKPTANKYRDLLMAHHGWVLTQEKRGRKGRGRRASVMTKTKPEDDEPKMAGQL